MKDYSGFRRYLGKTNQREIRMSFAQIERVLGAKMPASAYRHRPWWSNNPSNNPLTRAWLEAGFQSAEVDMAGQHLVFRRITPSSPPAGGQGMAGWYGKLKGLVTFAPGLDLTAPADPELADYLDAKVGSARRVARRT